MIQKSKFKDHVDANVSRKVGNVERMLFGSIWEWEQWREGELLDCWVDHNMCVNEGLNHILGAAFKGATSYATWYVALFSDNHTPASNNTYATPGYTEATAYSAASRVTCQFGAVSSKSLTNSANKASFTMSAAATIYGGALVNQNTKGDTADSEGKLFCVAQFASGAKTLASGDELKVTITLSNADS